MSDRRFRRVARAVSWLGTMTALFCTPPVARHVLCIDELHASDVVGMWTFAALLAGVAWLVAPRRSWLTAAFFGLLALIGVELAARVGVRLGDEQVRDSLAQLARRTYGDYAAYGGHPFLQYTGRAQVSLIGNEALGMRPEFNGLGFHGEELQRGKPAGTVRICCLGGSTTASGYPARMRDWLAERNPGTTFESANFGLGFYTSNHAIVNFVLNVIDLEPDYVVFHHGWNDTRCAGNAGRFRTDYSHVLQPYRAPVVPDALLIRASLLYRYLKHRVDPAPEWSFLDASLVRPQEEGLRWDRKPVAVTFRKNVRTFVDLCEARGIVPVLVTQPHSLDPNVPFAAAREGIEQFAGILRELANGFGDRVLFVDLDRELTGHSDHLFRDVGHMTTEGIALKAERIAAVIDAHRRGG